MMPLRIKLKLLLIILSFVVGTTYGQSMKDTTLVNQLNKSLLESVYNNTSRAKSYGKQSIEIARKIGYKKGEAIALSRMGIVYDVEGNFDSALYYYRSSYSINLKIGYKKGQGGALCNMGLAYLNRNDYANAIKFLRAAIKPLQDAGEHEYLGNCYNNIGLMYLELDNYARASDNFKLAEKEYLSSGNTRQLTHVLSNYAMVYSEKRDYDSAIILEQRAIKYFEKDSDYYNLAKSYNNLGIDYVQKKDYVNAEKMYLTSIKYAQLFNSKGGLADTYFNLATVYSLVDRIPESEMYIQKAMDLLPYIKSVKIKADLFFIYARIKRRIGDYKSASNYLMESKKLKDSIFKSEIAELITKSEIRFGLEQKEYENKQLQQKNRIQRLELLNRENEVQFRKNFNFVLIVLSLLIIFLLVMYFKRRFEVQKLLSEKTLRNEQQSQRVQISHELHDNVGAQLSYIVGNLEVLQNQHPDDKRIRSIGDMSKQAIVTLRETVWALNNESISILDFSDKFKQYTSKILDFNPDISCRFEEHFQDEKTILQPIQALNLFRICQEAFSNAVHHSNAKNITIQFNNLGKILFNVKITDDGIGFDQEEAALKGHYGLQTMRTRASELGAEFNISSIKGEGTTVEFNLKSNT